MLLVAALAKDSSGMLGGAGSWALENYSLAILIVS